MVLHGLIKVGREPFTPEAKGGGLVNKKADNVPEWYAEACCLSVIGKNLMKQVLTLSVMLCHAACWGLLG